MATYGQNIAEDAEMADCDDDKVVTMMDVLKQQQKFEEDANAVLGASDDKNCTYSKGYIKRQALYACLTCCPEARVDHTKRAGVCLACSLCCHENHELIELYTRRNFRCDCGNPKFNTHLCQFTPVKTELNDGNTYNQNFSGLYCTCHRPYPDPESTFEDDMIQCTICEDWLHASHLEAVVPANDQYSEMICKNCMEKNEFLHDYSMYAVIVEADVDIVTGNGDTRPADPCNRDSNMVQSLNGTEKNKTEIETTSVTVNEDVEIDEGKVNSEDNATVSTDIKNDKENVAAETNKDISIVESIEIKHEENTDNEASKMDLDTESQIVNVEQSEGISETNKPIKTETPDEPLEEGSEVSVKEKTNVTSDVAENTPIAGPEQNKDTTSEKAESTVEKPENSDITDAKIESTDNESEQADKIIKEQNEEQIGKHSISDEVGDGNNVQGNKSDASERIEQQLLTALTDENPSSAAKTDADSEEKAEQTSLGSLKQSDDSIVKKDVQTNNEESPKKTVNASGDQYVEKPVVAVKTATGDIEVPDTSQSDKNAEEKTDSAMNTMDVLSETGNKAMENAQEETDSAVNAMDELTENTNKAKEHAEEKTDSAMNAMDELTKTDDKTKENAEEETDSVINAMNELTKNTNKPKEKETENKEPNSESKENKEKADTIEVKDSGNIETSASDKKSNDEVPEQRENDIKSNDKPSTNDTEDIEMGDIVIKIEPGTESKVDKPATDSENKLVSDENPVLTDTVNESIKQESVTLNETDDTLKIENKIDNGLKTNIGNYSTNITEPKHENEVPNVTENGNEHKRKINTSLTDDTSPKKVKKVCVRPKPVNKVLKGATFWPSTFRQKLCTCAECLSMYKDLKVLFLTDHEDTVFAYESLGKANEAGGASQYEKGMQALSSLDRVQQINALSEYTRMRDKLLLYLKSFRDRKEVVKEEDIRAFFAGMKPRRERDGVYFLS